MLFFAHNDMDSLVMMLEKNKGVRTMVAVEAFTPWTATFQN